MSPHGSEGQPPLMSIRMQVDQHYQPVWDQAVQCTIAALPRPRGCCYGLVTVPTGVMALSFTRFGYCPQGDLTTSRFACETLQRLPICAYAWQRMLAHG